MNNKIIQRLQVFLLLFFIILLLIFSSTCNSQPLSAYESKTLRKVSHLLDNNLIKSALDIVLPLLEVTKPHSTTFQYACATLQLDNQNELAASCWRQGADIYPLNVNIGLNLANAQLEHSDYEGAIDSLEGIMLIESAKVYKHQIQDSNLQQFYQQKSQIRYMLAFAHYQLSHYLTVINILESKDIKPNWWGLILHSLIALEDWERAKDTVNEWLTISPDNVTAWQILARVEIGLGNRQASVGASHIAHLITHSSTTINSSNNLDTFAQQGTKNHLFGHIKAYNIASQCINIRLHHFEQQALACTQYNWLSGQYQDALNYMQEFDIDDIELKDEYFLLQGRLYEALKANNEARNAWSKVGQGLLPDGASSEIKLARHKRNKLQGQALLLIGQSYWLAQQWPEAQASYRKLKQTVGFESVVKAYELRLKQIMDLK